MRLRSSTAPPSAPLPVLCAPGAGTPSSHYSHEQMLSPFLTPHLFLS